MKKSDPNKSFVNLNYRCNNNCISCIMENHYQEGSNLTLSRIKKEINKILPSSNHIEFNGGEPTLRKDLFKILSYSNSIKKNVEIGLISNVRVFSSEKNVRKLLRLKLDNFKIITTIYGHNANLHDSITRTPNSFEQQIRGIRNLIDAGMRVELRIVLHKLNHRHMEDIADYLIKRFQANNFININLINAKLTGQALKNKEYVAIRTREIIPYLEKGAKKLINSGFKVKLSHFPHCVLPKSLWKYSVGLSAEKTEVIFLKKCNDCLQKEKCSGFWKSYSKLFRIGEFI